MRMRQRKMEVSQCVEIYVALGEIRNSCTAHNGGWDVVDAAYYII